MFIDDSELNSEVCATLPGRSQFLKGVKTKDVYFSYLKNVHLEASGWYCIEGGDNAIRKLTF